MYIYAKIGTGCQERVRLLRKRTQPVVGERIEIELREPYQGKERLTVRVSQVGQISPEKQVPLYFVEL